MIATLEEQTAERRVPNGTWLHHRTADVLLPNPIGALSLYDLTSKTSRKKSFLINYGLVATSMEGRVKLPFPYLLQLHLQPPHLRAGRRDLQVRLRRLACPEVWPLCQLPLLDCQEGSLSLTNLALLFSCQIPPKRH